MFVINEGHVFRGVRPEATERGLRVETRNFGDAAIVRLDGELDASTVGAIDELPHGAEEAERLTLDLSLLSFADCAGVRAIERIAQRRCARGRQVEVSYPTPPVQRLFELVGMQSVRGVRLRLRSG
jgi:anti-anti-sigma factor